MSQFLAGFLTAIAAYIVVGVLIGVYVVITHLSYFFAAGWQWKRMAGTVFANTVGWPAALFDIVYQAVFLRCERQRENIYKPDPPFEDPYWVESEDVDDEPFVKAKKVRGAAAPVNARSPTDPASPDASALARSPRG
jgi:hypothetical protein